MKKLKLELERLAVESFDTTTVSTVLRGTVNGLGSPGTRTLPDASNQSCDGMCGETDSCTVTEVSCVEQTWDTCMGSTCFGVSCGPAGSCSEGCFV